jgi:hypothetical protein
MLVFFVWNKKKVRRKHDNSRSIHIHMCFLLPFLSLLKFFFVSSLLSRLGDNSRRYHYTCTVWPWLSPVGDSEEKKLEEKESAMNLTFRAGTHERKKEMNSVIIAIYFFNYRKTNAYIYSMHRMRWPLVIFDASWLQYIRAY